MRRAAAFGLVACLTLCLLASSSSTPALPFPRPPRVAPATIEPTLPLQLTLRLSSVVEAARGGTARLELAAEAGAPIRDLTLKLGLPDGVRAPEGDPISGARAALAARERRQYDVPLAADRRGIFPIRVSATFRLDDGRSFETTQGATLSLGVEAPAGRSNAGAYEFMAVPLEELTR